jgi:hypothetical protein
MDDIITGKTYRDNELFEYNVSVGKNRQRRRAGFGYHIRNGSIWQITLKIAVIPGLTSDAA